MDQPATPPAAGPTPPTLWKQGAGAGTAVGAAISTCVMLGIAPQWSVPVAVGGWVVGTLLGTVVGSLIGWAVPVVETKTDPTAVH